MLIKLRDIFYDSLRPTKLITIVTSILAGIAMCVPAADPAQDFMFLTNLVPGWGWAMLFLAHATGRLLGLFYLKEIKSAHYLVSAIGIWLWSMLFTSSAIMTPLEGMGLLYIILIVIEVWILCRNIMDIDDTTTQEKP